MSSDVAASKKLAATFEAEIEALLSQLSPEELEELNNDVDPDNSLLPPSQRVKNQTDKTATGPFDREKLLKFLEDKAKNEKDWEQNKPFVKEVRGKKFEPKIKETEFSKDDLASMGIEADLADDIDQTLKGASEEELVDLAAVLGFTGLLTQEQVIASLENKDQAFGGFNAVTKSQKLKLFPYELPNSTDIEASIKSIESNDAELKELILNNIKNISGEEYGRLFEALKSNKTLEKLHCANTRMTPSMADKLCEALQVNTTLKSLNIESNHLTGQTLVKIAKAIDNDDSGLVELRACNQRQGVLGVLVEQELTKIILQNRRLKVFAVDLDTADARCRIHNHVVSNIDRLTRQQRTSKER